MNKKGILVVEDNITDGLVIKRTFSALTNEPIRIARNGKEAFDALVDDINDPKEDGIELPRIITVDINMPIMNGFEFIEAIKSREGLKEIPVIVLTSTQLPDEIKKAYRLGANSFVVKPTEHEEFERKIEEIYHYWLDFVKLPQE